MDWYFFSAAFLACFFSLVAGIYIVRLTVGDKTRSVKKVHTGPRYSKTWWNHMIFRWFRAAIWVLCVTRVFVPTVDNYLGVFPALMQPQILLSGVLMLCCGFIIALVSHRQLGQSWRSGIDPKGPSQLIQQGLYRYSRNPMYIGVITAQTGFFLALPSIFTLLCLALGISAIIRQVGAEEIHLKQHLPTLYQRYTQTVPRWL